ncbi:MAG TPA: hypothetical protein EYQ26_01945, partial [Rhodospirillales bacterium]|nr:hypothetical protein [Rhodospirillales bacterium]
RVVVTVDCGISNTKEVAVANGLGVDVIIVDHHEIPRIQFFKTHFCISHMVKFYGNVIAPRDVDNHNWEKRKENMF